MDKSPEVLLELVERLGNLLRAEFRRAGADEQLQPVHVHALVYLTRANRYSNTPQAMAEYLGLTKGTMSQSLLLLDRRGLIERYQDDLDRRVVRLVTILKPSIAACRALMGSISVTHTWALRARRACALPLPTSP